MGLLSFLTGNDADRRAYERARFRWRSTREGKARSTPVERPSVARHFPDRTGIPIGLTADGEVVRLPSAVETRHGIIAGSSGSGKSSFALGVVLQLIDAACGWTTTVFPAFPDPGTSLELIDPKGELATLVMALTAAIYDAAPEAVQERLTGLFRLFDLTVDGVTPMPLFGTATDALPPAYRADLRVQVEDEGADHRATELSRYVRAQYYKVLAHLGYPLNYAFSLRFFTDPLFRARVLERVPERDLRLYWGNFDQLVPRATAAAVLRFLHRRIGDKVIRLGIGLPKEDEARLLGSRPPARITLGNFAARTLPAARAMEQARLRTTDACAEAVIRAAATPGQLVVDEVGMLFHRSMALQDVFALASRTLRSAGLGLTLIGQDFETAVPGDLVTTLKLNAVWTALFRSDATEGSWVYPFVETDDPALVGATDAERKRNFLRHVQVLPTRRFYLHVKGLPAVPLTALPVPYPDPATPERLMELRERFLATIGKRSIVSVADAEAAIEAWEARVVAGSEIAPAEPRGRVVSMDDAFRDLDEEGSDGPR